MALAILVRVSDAGTNEEATRKDAALRITMPADLFGCHALIEQLTCTVDELRRAKQELELTCAELMQRAFRNRSERYLHDPNQLRLDFKDTDAAADAAEGLAQAVEEAGHPVKAHMRRRRVRKPRNEALPEHLPRYEVEAGVPNTTALGSFRIAVGGVENAVAGFDKPAITGRNRGS